MARSLGKPEYRDNPDDEDESFIELSTSRGRPSASGRSAASALDNVASSPGSGYSATCRCAALLFALALVVNVYHLGLRQGKEEGTVGPARPAVGPRDEGNGPAQRPAVGPRSGFTLERLQATREEAARIVSLLEGYYSGGSQADRMLMAPWLEPWDFDAPEDKKEASDRAAKLVDTMARALVTDDQKTFLMGGIGSSVMAGHDNCHYDSYQTQMERLWSPVWKAAGMDFVFQNAGEGGSCGDSHENQHYCVKQNVSPDVDVVHYSWTYFEGGKAAPVHEDLIRWTQMLPKSPPVHVYYTGEVPNGDSPYGEVAKHYAKYGYNAFYMKTGFRNGGHDYEKERTRPDNPIDRFGRGIVGDGYHDTTRYGELEQDKVRRDSLGVVMRNWHPGPLGFQLTSDAFAMVYTRALLRALDLIERDMMDGNDPQEKWAASNRPLLLKSDLPPPKYCDQEYCVVDEAPSCTNYEEPTFGYWGAKVEDPNDALNPYTEEPNQNWNVWHQENNLWHMVGRIDESYFMNREDKEICRHLDACGGISAQKADDGTVVFRLPKMEVGLVVVCGCCGKQAGEELLLNNPDIEISYNTVPVDRREWDLWPNKKCVRILKRFPTSGRAAETPTGHAYLAVKVLKDMAKPVRISHVITL